MKDPRFIELVNLYIDRQITAEETAELEAEIQRNPARRRAYQDYCRLHRATRLVYESFRPDAAPAASFAPAPAGITQIAQRARTRGRRWRAAVGGLAAAACLALFFGLRADFSGKSEPVLAPAAGPEFVAAKVPEAEEPVVSLLELEGPVVVFASRPGTAPDYGPLVSALRDEDRRLLATKSAVERLSLFEDEVFSVRPELIPVRSAPTWTPRRGRGPAEFTAFQFQR